MPAIIPKETLTETYIWDEGYARPDEAERICIFVCSCIESAAERLGCKAKEIYERMDRVGLIHGYLIPCYDTLHTESREILGREERVRAALKELSRHQPNNQIGILRQKIIDKYLHFLKSINI